MKARGGEQVTLGGVQYPVMMTMKALASIETDCGFASVVQVKQGLVYKSTALLESALKHVLIAGGADNAEVEKALNEADLAEFDAARTVIDTMLAPLFPKKPEAEAENNPTNP